MMDSEKGGKLNRWRVAPSWLMFSMVYELVCMQVWLMGSMMMEWTVKNSIESVINIE